VNPLAERRSHLLEPRSTEPRNILIRAPNWVGDIVMATGSFADLRCAFPQARITVLLRPGREKILEGSPDHDRILLDRARNSPLGVWRLARELRRERFDLALIYSTSFPAALVPWLAGVPRRVGYRANLRGAFLTDPLEYDVQVDEARRPGPRGRRWRLPVPMPELYARLCEVVGVPRGDGRPRLCVTPECELRAAALRRELGIADGERLVGLNPGASFGSSKLWPAERFARLADLVTERHGLRTMILVGPGEEPIARAISSGMRTAPVGRPDLVIPLDVLKPIVRDLALLVTTDTGTRQYAVALGVPVVVVMGPVDPRFSAANLELSEIVRHDLPCSPCNLKVCPIDHRCMVGIGSEEVLERIEALDRRVGIFDR
jgi:heptosyltransferase-2